MSAGHIRQRSPGSWEIRYPVPPAPDGKRRTETKTVRGSKRDAQAALRAAMGTVDRGEHVEATKRTVGEHIKARVEQWQASGQISSSTHEHYEQLVALIAAHLGNVPLQKLTTVQLERWHTALRTKGLSAPVIRHAHNLLSRALADAVRHNLLVRNLAREQKPPAGRSAEVAIIPADQIAPMLARLEGSDLQAPVIVALYCGLRRGEQLALKWANVDLDGAKLHVVEALEETSAGVTVKTPKTAAGRRTISLPAIVVAALRAHRRAQLEMRLVLGLGKPSDDALVFPGMDGRHQSPRALSMAWLRATRRLGLPAVNWHALRHTHASMLIAVGVDVVTVSKRLGHSKPDVTLRVYSHLFAADDSAAAAAIDRALGQ
jgi:integrase